MSSDSTPVRANPFATLDDLNDFHPVAAPKPKLAVEMVRQVSEASNFPSRAATAPKSEAVPETALPPRTPQRRHRTGRNVQINLKVTAATSERFTRLSEEQGWVFGQTLDHALDALEIALKSKESG